MLTLATHHTVEFRRDKVDLAEGAAYALRARGPHPQLLLNWDYLGVLIFDCRSARVTKTTAFPESVDGFSIQKWLVSPDGAASYLFGSDGEDFALEINHESDAVRKVRLPPEFDTPSGLCCFLPELYLRDTRYGIWAVRGDRLERAADDEPGTRLLRNISKRLGHFGVTKMSPTWRGAYVMHHFKVGYFPLEEGEPMLAPHDGDAVDVTHFKGHLLLLFEYELFEWADGRRRSLLTPSPGEYFLAVEVLAVGEAGTLAVLSSKQDNSASVLRLFQLTE